MTTSVMPMNVLHIYLACAMLNAQCSSNSMDHPTQKGWKFMCDLGTDEPNGHTYKLVQTLGMKIVNAFE